MIPLQLPTRFDDPDTPPFVARLGDEGVSGASLVAELANDLVFQHDGASFAIDREVAMQAVGDVVFAEPAAGRISRWIRKDSLHNTLLVTERCDQLCIMCSQPPRKSHIDRFAFFLEACRLAQPGATIGLSGGEPTLFLPALVNLVRQVALARPDISFHILTNAQHFREDDIGALREPAFANVLWGVPVYAAKASLHDRLVGKSGAHRLLRDGLSILARAGQAVELRTVLMQPNYAALPDLARFVVGHAPFVVTWALMQLEAAGFARTRWGELFVDHSREVAPLATAVALASAHGIETVIYNTPHCSVPEALRSRLRPSISDWKRAFPADCEPCSQRSACSGFFTWRAQLADYERAHPI